MLGGSHCYAWQVGVPYFIHFIFICMLGTHIDFSTIYFILNILYMDINRSTTPLGQLWLVCLILLYVIYNKYFHLTTTMTHFYVYQLRINCKIGFARWFSSQARLNNHGKVLLYVLCIMTLVEGFLIVFCSYDFHMLKSLRQDTEWLFPW